MGTYILADNQELTGYALESLLRHDAVNHIVHVANKAALIEQLKAHECCVVLLDYRLFDFQNEDQLLVLSERFDLTSWVLLSDELSDRFLRKMVYASHRFSIVFKDSSMKQVSEAIRCAAAHDRYIDQRVTELLLRRQWEQQQQVALTQTETDILRSIVQGHTTKEIAAERFSSIHTINTHRKNIFRKLGVNTAHEAMKYALMAGLVDPSEFYI